MSKTAVRSTASLSEASTTVSTLVARLRGQTPHQYRDSFGHLCQFSKDGMHFWHIAGQALQVWNGTPENPKDGLYYRLREYLEINSRSFSTSSTTREYLIDPYMIGHDEYHAQPTAVIRSCDFKNAKALRKLVTRCLLAQAPDFRCRTVPWHVEGLSFSSLSAQTFSDTRVFTSYEGQANTLPTPGSSIVSKETGSIATLGGYIFKDNQCFGVTAAHAFLAPSKVPSTATVTAVDDFDSDDVDDDDSDDFAWQACDFRARDTLENPADLQPRKSYDAKYEYALGDVSLLPTEEPGSRWLDCAFIELRPELSTYVPNIFMTNTGRWIRVEESMTAPHAGAVVVTGGFTGWSDAHASAAISLLKTRHASQLQEVFAVELHSGFRPGDSGSWVLVEIGKHQYQLLGMLVGGSMATNTAYFVSAQQVLDTLAESFLGASKTAVTLREVPGPPKSYAKLMEPMRKSSEAYPSMPSPPEMVFEEQLGVISKFRDLPSTEKDQDVRSDREESISTDEVKVVKSSKRKLGLTFVNYEDPVTQERVQKYVTRSPQHSQLGSLPHWKSLISQVAANPWSNRRKGDTSKKATDPEAHQDA